MSHDCKRRSTGMKPVSRAHGRCWMKWNLGWSVVVASTMLVLAACGDGGGTLTVTVSSIDGASGKVALESTPAHDEGVEIDCSAGCTISFDEGTQVTLTQSPAEGYYFGGWSGYCAGTPGKCTFEITQSVAVQVTFTPANLVFTTRNRYTISDVKARSILGGPTTDAEKMFSGADEICRELGGSNDFSAWLASSSQNAATRGPLAGARGWVRPDGRPFKDGLPGQATMYPARLDQGGALVANFNNYTFTGAKEDGTADGTCGDWSGSGLLGGGKNDSTGRGWTDYTSGTCDPTDSGQLLCLQTRYSAVVSLPPPPPGARFIFATSTTIAANAGLGGFDSLCTTEAAGRLPGTYKALVATTTASAASRFSLRNVPIYLPSGAMVFDLDTKLAEASPEALAPVSFAADGTQHLGSGVVWTGATSPSTKGGVDVVRGTCNDWTSTAKTDRTFTGFVQTTGTWFRQNASFDCAGMRIVYCLQE
jgi:hypothetical protein